MILTPNGGEILSATIDIIWQLARDSQLHEVTYSLYYSADDGASWIPLVQKLNASVYSWDTTTLPDGDRYKIQIEGNCTVGLRVEDISDYSFSIHNTKTTTTSTSLIPSKSSIPTSTEPNSTFPSPGLPFLVPLVCLSLLIHVKKRK
ncbi:MAG: hypothetical protein ACFFFH_07620 [Candidatus Thorarchaeota archaeon]